MWRKMLSKWRSRRTERRWTKTHCVFSLWCVFLLVSLCSSCCLTQKLHLLFQLHYPQPRASCSNTWRSPKHEMSPTPSSKDALGPQGQPGGAGPSGALIAGRVNECVCLRARPRSTAGVASSLVESELLMWQHLRSRVRHMRTLKTILGAEFILLSTRCIAFKFFPQPQNPLPLLGVNSWADVRSCSLATQTCSGPTDLANVDSACCPC